MRIGASEPLKDPAKQGSIVERIGSGRMIYCPFLDRRGSVVIGQDYFLVA